MKYKIVLVPFPFDDLRANKVRPAVCLTDASLTVTLSWPSSPTAGLRQAYRPLIL